MRVEVTMPRMGQSMEEGVVLNWLKPLGAAVQRGEPLIAIESDKASVEIEAFATGRLVEILVPEGETAAVGAVLAIIEDNRTGESVAAIPGTQAQPAVTGRRVDASPIARRLAQEQGVDLTVVNGTGPGGRVTKDDVEAALKQRTTLTSRAQRIVASPVARRLAHEHQIDLAALKGSAPQGWIIKRDRGRAGREAYAAATASSKCATDCVEQNAPRRRAAHVRQQSRDSAFLFDDGCGYGAGAFPARIAQKTRA